MSWQTWEEAVTVGHVIYLYQFDFYSTYSDTTSVGFCTGRSEIVYNGLTFYPRPIVHSAIKFTYGDVDTTIHLPATKYWIDIFFKTEFLKCDLTIYRYKEELNGAIILFKGKYKKASLKTTTIDVEFGLGLNLANSEVITYWVQRYCNHIIYDKYCGLSQDAYKAEYTNFNITGDNVVELPSSPYFLGDSFDDFWREGLVILMGGVEIPNVTFFELPVPNLIASVLSPTSFSLKWNIPDYVMNYANKKITILPNCIGDLDRCKLLFGNLPRACGWPDMPSNMLTSDTLSDTSVRNRGNIGQMCLGDESESNDNNDDNPDHSGDWGP